MIPPSGSGRSAPLPAKSVALRKDFRTLQIPESLTSLARCGAERPYREGAMKAPLLGLAATMLGCPASGSRCRTLKIVSYPQKRAWPTCGSALESESFRVVWPSGQKRTLRVKTIALRPKPRTQAFGTNHLNGSQIRNASITTAPSAESDSPVCEKFAFVPAEPKTRSASCLMPMPRFSTNTLPPCAVSI